MGHPRSRPARRRGGLSRCGVPSRGQHREPARARERWDDYDITVGGTVALLEALSTDPPDVTVLTSTQLVYGTGAGAADELTTALRPATAFAAAKAAAEAFLCVYTERTGTCAVACRLASGAGSIAVFNVSNRHSITVAEIAHVVADCCPDATRRSSSPAAALGRAMRLHYIPIRVVSSTWAGSSPGVLRVLSAVARRWWRRAATPSQPRAEPLIDVAIEDPVTVEQDELQSKVRG